MTNATIIGSGSDDTTLYGLMAECAPKLRFSAFFNCGPMSKKLARAMLASDAATPSEKATAAEFLSR